MPSSNNSVLVVMTQSNPVLTTYGDGATGWLTDPLDVRGLDEIQLQFKLVKGSLAALDLKMQVNDPIFLAAVSAWADMMKVDAASGVISLEEFQFAPVADDVFAIRLDVQACSQIRFAAKGDTVTGDPTLDMYVVGEWGPSIDPVLTPDVAG